MRWQTELRRYAFVLKHDGAKLLLGCLLQVEIEMVVYFYEYEFKAYVNANIHEFNYNFRRTEMVLLGSYVAVVTARYEAYYANNIQPIMV